MKMKETGDPCAICGEWRGVGDHSECSKIRKELGTKKTNRKNSSLKQLDQFAKDIRKYGW